MKDLLKRNSVKMLNQILFGLCLATLLQIVKGFHCDGNEFDDFNFDSIRGLHHISLVKETPPSVSNLTWFVNLCGSIDVSAHKDYESLLTNCPENSQICGVKYVSVPGMELIKTEVISLSDSLSQEVTVDKNYKNPNKNNEETTLVQVKLNGGNWGSTSLDTKLSLICDKDANDDTENVKISTWDESTLSIDLYSSTFCSKSSHKPGGEKKPGEGNDKRPTGGGLLEFVFGLLFNLICVVIAIYIAMFGFTYLKRGGTFAEIHTDVSGRLLDIGSNIPALVREVIEKFTGNSSSRGGYSAV